MGGKNAKEPPSRSVGEMKEEVEGNLDEREKRFVNKAER